MQEIKSVALKLGKKINEKIQKLRKNTIRMSLTASIMRNINPTNDQRVARLQPMQVEAMAHSKRQRLGSFGGGGESIDYN